MQKISFCKISIVLRRNLSLLTITNLYIKQLFYLNLLLYNASWHKCKITHFIVPLYTKIYLEAYEAKNFIARFLISGPAPLNDGSEVLLRTYLASSRSFKDVLATNASFSSDLKDITLELAMPKFIWVTEISDKKLEKEKKANGLVILNATEANIVFNKPLIIAAYQGKVINFEAYTKRMIYLWTIL